MATIEYVYAAHSAFAYLGSARLMQIVKASGATLLHRPVDLRRVVPAAGSAPFGKRSPAHRAYYFGREIQRWSEERNAPVIGNLPTYHHHDIDLPNCFLIAAGESGDAVDRLAHALLQAHWRDDADLAASVTLVRLADEIGLDGEALLVAAQTDEVKAAYERYTQDAIDRSVFGSPTYFVDGDMFYGQDRLEMVERALRQPYRR
jgi:2-hydroxychromene-2-carboxylate isomerase